MKSSAGRLSQSTIAGFIGAAAFAVLTAGTAVAVSTTAVSITNPSTGKRAHVTGQSSLVTSQRDPYSGTYAKVDANGRQVVGHGVPVKTWAQTFMEDVPVGKSWGGPRFTIPTAGRMTVRGVSISFVVPQGQTATLQIEYTDASDRRVGVFVPTTLVRTTYGTDTYVGNWDVPTYPLGGTIWKADISRSSTAGHATVTATVLADVS